MIYLFKIKDSVVTKLVCHNYYIYVFY